MFFQGISEFLIFFIIYFLRFYFNQHYRNNTSPPAQEKEEPKTKQQNKVKPDAILKTSGEFLSGLKREDRLHPMVSICIYYGEDDWDGPLKLTFSKRGYNYGIRFYTTYYKRNPPPTV